MCNEITQTANYFALYVFRTEYSNCERSYLSVECKTAKFSLGNEPDFRDVSIFLKVISIVCTNKYWHTQRWECTFHMGMISLYLLLLYKVCQSIELLFLQQVHTHNNDIIIMTVYSEILWKSENEIKEVIPI